MGRITITIKNENSRLIRDALKTEIASSPFEKSTLEVAEENGQLVVVMESGSMAALRGTFNSVMNWLRVILLGME